MKKPEWLWPDDATHLSGPVSVAVFKGFRGGDLYLLGDAHFDYSNECFLPLPGKALTLYELVTKALREHRDARVYVEYPVSRIPGLPKKHRWYLDRLRTLLEMDDSLEAKVGAALSSVLGVPQPVVGEFGKLHGEFPEGSARIVPLDIRTEPNVHVWEALARAEGTESLRALLFSKVVESSQIRRWLNAYLHSDDFLAACKVTFAHHPLAEHFVAATLAPGGRHVIRAKFLALAPSDRRAVSDFFRGKVEQMVRLHARARSDAPTQDDARAVLQSMQALVMDMYALCVLLADVGRNSVTLVFCGDYHVANYARFFEACGGRKPDLRAKMSELPNGAGLQRCIDLRPAKTHKQR